jgi:hypothetical protein
MSANKREQSCGEIHAKSLGPQSISSFPAHLLDFGIGDVKTCQNILRN